VIRSARCDLKLLELPVGVVGIDWCSLIRKT